MMAKTWCALKLRLDGKELPEAFTQVLHWSTTKKSLSQFPFGSPEEHALVSCRTRFGRENEKGISSLCCSGRGSNRERGRRNGSFTGAEGRNNFIISLIVIVPSSEAWVPWSECSKLVRRHFCTVGLCVLNDNLRFANQQIQIHC